MSAGLRSVVAVLAALSGLPAAVPAAGASTFGEQRTLVIPLKYPTPPCPDARRACPDGVDRITPPRNPASQLRRVLQEGVDRHYRLGSYGRVRWRFRMVSARSEDGWFIAPRSAQAYAHEPDDFASGGIVEQAVEHVLARAVRDGRISIDEVLRHRGLLVVTNWHNRSGHASGRPIRYTVRGREWAPTAAVAREDVNDALLASSVNHQLGHNSLLLDDLSSTPCEPEGDGVADPCTCPNIEPGGLGEAMLGDEPDCVGFWDTMAFDTPGVGFSSFTRMRAGWIRPTDPWVRTESAQEFRGVVDLSPLSRVPKPGRTSVLRLPRIAASELPEEFRRELTSTSVRRPYTGYQAECRRAENDDALIRGIGSSKASEGVVLSWIDDTRGPDKHPMHVVRTAATQGHRDAMLEIGETYSNATTGLTLTMRGFADDGSCTVEVNYDPPQLSNLAAPVGHGVARVSDRADLFGDSASTAIFLAGGVALGDRRLHLDAPERGRDHTVRFGYLNNGQEPTQPGRARLRVSQPYTAAPSCGDRTRPPGKVVSETALAPIRAGEGRLDALRWRPRSGGSTGLSIELDAPGDAVPGDDALTSAFAFQTHRQRMRGRSAAEQTKVRLSVPEGCGEAVAFHLSPVALPRGWKFAARGASKPVPAGASRTATVVVRAPSRARPGTVSIPVVVTAVIGGGVHGDGPHEGIVGGLDVIAAVVRGKDDARFRLTASALRRPPRPSGQRFPLPPADPPAPAPTPTPTPTAVPTPTPTPTPQQQGSTIALSCPSGVKSAEPVPVEGAIEPPHAATVTLHYRDPKGQTQTQQATSGPDGRFGDSFKPASDGNWTLTASWPGDGDHAGASNSCTFTVG